MRIEKSFYEEIRKVMPTPSTDIVVLCQGKVLLLLRKNIPAKGLWFFPGGSIQKGESPLEAATRELREETGIDSKSLEYVGVRSVLFREDDIHALSFVFRLVLNDIPKVTLDDESSQYKWCNFTDPKVNAILTSVLISLTISDDCTSVHVTEGVL